MEMKTTANKTEKKNDVAKMELTVENVKKLSAEGKTQVQMAEIFGLGDKRYKLRKTMIDAGLAKATVRKTPRWQDMLNVFNAIKAGATNSQMIMDMTNLDANVVKYAVTKLIAEGSIQSILTVVEKPATTV